MRQNKKFEKKARYHSRLALLLTLAIFATAFAAIYYGENMQEVLPDFLKELLNEKPDVPRA